jgi:glutathione S-transferase
MKLYYIPGTCALAPHIFARHADIPLEIVRVDWTADGKFVAGQNYLQINRKGKVPALDTGDMLVTETQVILQYLAGLDRSRRGVATDTVDWPLLETLNFIATEIHKAFSPLWLPSLGEGSARAEQIGVLTRNFQTFEQLLGDEPYLLGDRFSVADAYAYVVLRWCDVHRIDLADFARINAYLARVAQLPAVRQALDEEAST